MTYASAHNEEMEDFMTSEIFMFHVENWKL